jgi:hypothetical protein
LQNENRKKSSDKKTNHEISLKLLIKACFVRDYVEADVVRESIDVIRRDPARSRANDTKISLLLRSVPLLDESNDLIK